MSVSNQKILSVVFFVIGSTAFEHIIHLLGSVSTVGAAYTAHSEDSGKAFPFVSLPNFAQQTASARHMSGAIFVGFCPIVTRENFEKWDEYVTGDENKWM